MKPTIAIDGPAGAGKSTVSRGVARRLGLRHVDTGAMYRVVGVLAEEAGLAPGDVAGLAALCDGLALRFADAPGGVRVHVDGRDLTEAIRSVAAGQFASRVAALPVVRERLVALQRRLAAGGGVVMEGRDIGTVVLPEATLKIYLSASVAERARRRHTELLARGEPADLEAIAGAIAERDRRDEERLHSPLRPADDALRVDTTGEPLAAVIAHVCALVAARGNP